MEILKIRMAPYKTSGSLGLGNKVLSLLHLYLLFPFKVQTYITLFCPLTEQAAYDLGSLLSLCYRAPLA